MAQEPKWPGKGPNQSGEKLVQLSVKVQPAFLLALSRYVTALRQQSAKPSSKGKVLQDQALRNKELRRMHREAIKDLRSNT